MRWYVIIFVVIFLIIVSTIFLICRRRRKKRPVRLAPSSSTWAPVRNPLLQEIPSVIMTYNSDTITAPVVPQKTRYEEKDDGFIEHQHQVVRNNQLLHYMSQVEEDAKNQNKIHDIHYTGHSSTDIEDPEAVPTTGEAEVIVAPTNRIIDTFSVVSYNIRVDTDPSPHTWNHRKAHVFQNINQYTPSVICLQEATPKVIKDFLVKAPHFESVGAWRSSNDFESSPILYDTRIWQKLESATYLLKGGGVRRCAVGACEGNTSFGKNLVAKHPRVMTHTRLRNGVNIVNVLNTHYPLATSIQKKCSEVIASFISKKLGKEPVILCGDFNSYDGAVAPNTTIPHLMNAASLYDAHNGQDTPSFGTFGGHFKKGSKKIDFILYNHVAPISSVISDFRYGPQKFRPSDHSCIAATFSFGGKK